MEVNFITSINDEAKQSFHYTLQNGETINFLLEYVENFHTWYFKSIEYKGHFIYNIKIVKSLNILVQFENIFPFKLYISDRPYFQSDFINGSCQIGIYDERNDQTF